MFSQKPIRILSAISIDNEYTRDYVSTMKEFHKTFKLIKEDNLIEKQFAPHVYVTPTTLITNTTPNTNPLANVPVTKNRKTRKRKNN